LTWFCGIQAAVKKEKAALMSLLKKALADQARLAAALLSQPSAAAAAAAAAAQQDPHSFAAEQQQQQEVPQLRLPQLVLLNLVKNPMDSKQQPEYLPALAVQQIDSLPLNPTASTRDKPQEPILLCLGADNLPLAVSVQHVVGIHSSSDQAAKLIADNEEQVQRLEGLLAKHVANKRTWTQLRKMTSCQVTFGSTLTANLAVSLNAPMEQFTMFGVSPDMGVKIEQQQAAVSAAKKQLRDLQQQEADDSNSGSSGGEKSEGGAEGVMSESVMRTLMKLKGKDRLNAARRLARMAKKLLAEAQEQDQADTWTSFMVSDCACAKGQGFGVWF
jgi:hypothetical protein